MKKEFKFWTAAEVKAAIACIEKFPNVTKAAQYLSPKIGRSVHNTVTKMYSIKKGQVKLEDGKVIRKQKVARVKTDKDAISFPQGFSFDFKPVRAEMFKDHVKLYF